MKITNRDLIAAIERIEQQPASLQIVFKEFLKQHIYDKRTNVGLRVCDEVDQLIRAGFVVRVDDPEALLRTFARNELNALIEPLGVPGFKKNMNVNKLVAWCLENIPEDIPVICSKALTVTLSPELTKSRHKIYIYMSRKYNTDNYYDPDTGEERSIPRGSSFSVSVSLGGVSGLSLNFPDDEITALLDRHGVNPCKDWLKR